MGMKTDFDINELKKRQVLTTSELIFRANAEGYALSNHALRIAIRTGALPVRKIGTKSLIAWTQFVRWVTCADDCDNPPVPQPVEPPRPAVPSFEPARGIRRIAVRG